MVSGWAWVLFFFIDMREVSSKYPGYVQVLFAHSLSPLTPTGLPSTAGFAKEHGIHEFG